MAKMPLAWHKQNLAAVSAYFDREKAKLEEATRNVDRIFIDMERLRAQVKSAEAAGKDGFDADKYLKKRG